MFIERKIGCSRDEMLLRARSSFALDKFKRVGFFIRAGQTERNKIAAPPPN